MIPYLVKWYVGVLLQLLSYKNISHNMGNVFMFFIYYMVMFYDIVLIEFIRGKDYPRIQWHTSHDIHIMYSFYM